MLVSVCFFYKKSNEVQSTEMQNSNSQQKLVHIKILCITPTDLHYFISLFSWFICPSITKSLVFHVKLAFCVSSYFPNVINGWVILLWMPVILGASVILMLSQKYLQITIYTKLCYLEVRDLDYYSKLHAICSPPPPSLPFSLPSSHLLS